ncbi:MAG: imidazole glycerol phosphate synthase subunit HisH [Phycisphaerales bacterium]|nr:imidazole glycerol phosphate synthase subunit HisH [Phycisphaerales bacterium]
MIGVIDYGAGNMQSVVNALEHIGAPHRVCRAPHDVQGVERLILPGVGHFGPAASHLERTGLRGAILDFAACARPMLGICLGLQLLFESSEESPGTPGLGLLPGAVVRLRTRPCPHMGWNRVRPLRPCALLREPTDFYFAHSFMALIREAEDLAAVAQQEDWEIAAVVQRGALHGVQFHPEKSSDAGLALLRSFAAC